MLEFNRNDHCLAAFYTFVFQFFFSFCSNCARYNDTCLYSIQFVASCSVLNSTKAKPRDAPKRLEEIRAKKNTKIYDINATRKVILNIARDCFLIVST